MTTLTTAPEAGVVKDRGFSWSWIHPEADLASLLRAAWRDVLIALASVGETPHSAPTWHIQHDLGRLSVVLEVQPRPGAKRARRRVELPGMRWL